MQSPLQKSEPFEQRKGQLADGFWIGPGQLNELRFAWMILLHSDVAKSIITIVQVKFLAFLSIQGAE